MTFTKIVNGVASFVESTRVELQAYDGEDENSKHNQQTYLHQRSQGLQYGFKYNL